MSRMTFRSLTNKPEPVYTCAGSPVRHEYADCIDKHGVPGVTVVKDYNLDDYIQSSKDYCEIYNILERATGDPSLLEKVKTSYINCLDAPISLAESMQRKIDMERSFDSLPSAVRSLFGNNMLQLIDELNNGKAESKLRDFIGKDKRFSGKVDTVIGKEVKNNE